MTKNSNETWHYCAAYYEQHGYGPTTAEVAANFGINQTSAWKRIQRLVALGFCERDKGKKTRLRMVMVPNDGLRLDEAIRSAGNGFIRHPEFGTFSLSPLSCKMFISDEVLATGWEVVDAA